MKQKSFTKNHSIYVALELGSSKIACMVGKQGNNENMEILGYGTILTKSIRKGLVIDSEKIKEEIRFVVNEAEKQSQTKISSLILNATVTNTKSNFLKGKVEIKGEKIDDLHIKSAINQSDIYKIEEEFNNLHQVIRYFEIDKEKRVINPKGFFADELVANIYQILIKVNYLKSIKNILSQLNLNIERFVASPYASGLSTLIDDEKELGTICIDLGAGTTSVSIFENNNLMFAHAISMGSANITYDLTSGLTTSIDSAERLKTLYGSVFSNPSDEHELIDISITGSQEKKFNQINISELNSYIKPRVEETLELVRQKLKEYNLHNKKYRRVVLTGGGSLLDGIDEYAKIIFDSQVRVAYPNPNIKGLNDEIYKPQFAVSLGLLLSSQNYSEIDGFFEQNKRKYSKNTLFGRLSNWVDTYI